MPVSSATSRTQVSCSGSSGRSFAPVTLCQYPGLSARSISSTASAGVWITTSTDSGILWRRVVPTAGAASRRLRIAQPDVQLAQLRLVDPARCSGQQVLRALRLRECDHVANRIRLGHHRDDAVEPERDAAMRRRAVLQRIEQEAELGLRLLGADLQRAEHLAL